ncbi:cyclic pyranopterin monophosphate synthase MoaC, partial [Butyricicoccus sp. 1XD8-22]
MSKLTHFNSQGRAKMVDISEKNDTIRTAFAKTSIFVSEDIYHEITGGTNKKGDVLSVAQVSGIMAAKQTSNLIPMCHSIA